MNGDWQTPVTLLIVATAGGYLLLRIYRLFYSKQSGGCGSNCSGCNDTTSDTLGEKKQLVDLKITKNVSPEE